MKNLSYQLLFVTMRLLAVLPRALLRMVASLVSVLMYHLAVSRKKVARRNIELCFPGLDRAEQEALLKKHFRELGWTVVELPLAWFANYRRLEKMCEIDGLEHIHSVRRAGKGVLLVAGHFTSLEMTGCLLGQVLEYDAMYRSHKNPLFDRVQRQSRLRFTRSLVARDDLRSSLRLLKQGHVLWYAPDQDYGPKNSIFIPFMGVPAATLTATSRMAAMTSCAVVYMKTLRLAPWKYRIELSEPLEDFPGENIEKDTERLQAMLEANIREVPGQYLWVHRRFKTRPAGEASLYD